MDADASGEPRSLRSIADDPHRRPDPAVLAEVDRLIRSFRGDTTRLGLDSEFARTMSGLVVDAFRELDALPPSDAFREETNRRPTQYKLAGFCEKLLRERPGDIRALWWRAAVATVIGLSFHRPTLTRIMAVARPDITRPIGERPATGGARPGTRRVPDRPRVVGPGVQRPAS